MKPSGKRSGSSHQAGYVEILKKAALLFLAFIVIKIAVSCGGDGALENMFKNMFRGGDAAAAILGSELGVSGKQSPSYSKTALMSEAPGLYYYDAELEAALLEAEEQSETQPESSLPAPEPLEPEPEPQEDIPDEPAPVYDAPEVTLLTDVDLTEYISSDDITNKTSYDISPEDVIAEGLSLDIDPDSPQILIIHTHGSEAYTPDGEDTYTESDPMRTEDTEQNVVRVGDELAAAFEDAGISVLHDRSLYDYPSYNGSYSRSMEAIEEYLAEYPDIKMVIDLHRDAMDSSYVTRTEIDGNDCSQVLILIGTDYSGLYHPDWQENLKLGLFLQAAMNYEFPGLARPVKISEYRYNQHATNGSMILEVGYCTNTLKEAINAVRCFGTAAADVLYSFGQ